MGQCDPTITCIKSSVVRRPVPVFRTKRLSSRADPAPRRPPTHTSSGAPIDVHPTPTSLKFRVLYTYVRMYLHILGVYRSHVTSVYPNTTGASWGGPWGTSTDQRHVEGDSSSCRTQSCTFPSAAPQCRTPHTRENRHLLCGGDISWNNCVRTLVCRHIGPRRDVKQRQRFTMFNTWSKWDEENVPLRE
jgi:hypothetical protein